MAPLGRDSLKAWKMLAASLEAQMGRRSSGRAGYWHTEGWGLWSYRRGWAPIDPPGHSALHRFQLDLEALVLEEGDLRHHSLSREGAGCCQETREHPCSHGVEKSSVEDHLAGGRCCLTLHIPLCHRPQLGDEVGKAVIMVVPGMGVWRPGWRGESLIQFHRLPVSSHSEPHLTRTVKLHSPPGAWYPGTAPSELRDCP